MKLNCKPLMRLQNKKEQPTPDELNNAIPFVVGMSGHRDPRNISDVSKRCKQVFEYINSNSLSTPKILLSGMADGADQIAVKAALEADWQVIAVLPMPREEYLNDFDELGQERLKKLLDSCMQIIELPLVQAEQIDPDVLEPRQQQYRNLGAFMIRHSQLMVLCWDGDDSLQASPGGTLEVGRNCKKGVESDGESRLQPLRTVDTILVPTARVSGPESAAKEETQYDLISRKRNKRWSSTLHLINKFNESGRVKNTTLQKQKKQSKKWLLGGEVLTSKLCEELGPQLEVYAQADVISISQQSKRNKIVLLVIGILFLALFAQSVYGEVSMALSYLAIHVVLLLTSWGVYYHFFKIKQLDTSYLDYRALAEGLRVQIFWRLHGLRNCVSRHYLHDYNREIYWISEAISNLRLRCGDHADTDKHTQGLVRQYWIKGQRDYFIGQLASKPGKAHEHKLKERKANKLIKFFLGLGIFLTIITLVMHYFNLEGHQFIHVMTAANNSLSVWLNYLLLSATLSFGLSAGIAMYAEVQGYENRAASYLLIGQQFDTALIKYDAAQGNSKMKDAVVLEIGKEALAENENWLAAHRKITQSFINPY